MTNAWLRLRINGHTDISSSASSRASRPIPASTPAGKGESLGTGLVRRWRRIAMLLAYFPLGLESRSRKRHCCPVSLGGGGRSSRPVYPASRTFIRWHKMLYRLPCSPTSWETSSPDQTGAMQARGYGFLRTPLPHTLVNKGQLHTISCRVLVIDHVHRCLVELL